MPATERVFWCNDTCTVRVSYDDTGALVFYGNGSAYMGDEGHNYEYWVTVPPHQFSALRRALAAGTDADFLTWRAASGPGSTTTG